MSSIKHALIDSIPLDPREVGGALRRSTAQLEKILSAAGDPARPVKGLTWSVGEVAAHLAALAQDYRGHAEGGPGYPVPVARRSEVIEAGLARVSERDPRLLVEGVSDDLDAIADAVSKSTTDTVSRWYAEAQITLPLLGAIVAGEVLVHGWDIANSTGGVTVLDSDACRFALLATVAITPLFVTAKGATVDATLEFRIRGHEPVSLRLANGTAATTPGGTDRPDLWFAGEPAPFLLWYHARTGQLRPFLNRSIRLGGRRPWLMLRTSQWFEEG
jgi:uncharacterized protein (TIGR03083 family)